MQEKLTKKMQKVEFYILVFILSSMCGWIMEMLYISIPLKRLCIPGFLFGPYIPVYGMGTLIIITLCDDKDFFKRTGKIFVLTTALEYIISITLEMVVHKKWWDYSNNFLNINGRVCLLYSTYWTILGLIILEFLKPLFEKMYNKLKGEKLTKALIVAISIMAVDLLISIIYWY